MVHKGDLIKVQNVVTVCTGVHFVSAQCSFVLIRWCTRRFCMFVISSDYDGAQYDVFSLAGQNVLD